VFLGTGEVIFDAAPDPLIIGMFGYAIAHDAGDYLECLIEWFHETSWLLPQLIGELVPRAAVEDASVGIWFEAASLFEEMRATAGLCLVA
jgi:hypothetical protein